MELLVTAIPFVDDREFEEEGAVEVAAELLPEEELAWREMARPASRAARSLAEDERPSEEEAEA